MNDSMNDQYATVDSKRADVAPSRAVIRAVSEATGVDETSLKPLYEAVNPDALDELFGPRPDGTPRPGGSISFTMGGCAVVVRRDGTVEATLVDEDFSVATTGALRVGFDRSGADSVSESTD